MRTRAPSSKPTHSCHKSRSPGHIHTAFYCPCPQPLAPTTHSRANLSLHHRPEDLSKDHYRSNFFPLQGLSLLKSSPWLLPTSLSLLRVWPQLPFLSSRLIFFLFPLLLLTPNSRAPFASSDVFLRGSKGQNRRGCLSVAAGGELWPVRSLRCIRLSPPEKGEGKAAEPGPRGPRNPEASTLLGRAAEAGA